MWNIISNIIKHVFKFFKIVKGMVIPPKILPTGPNTLEELLQQFDLPPPPALSPEESQKDLINKYNVREMLMQYEIDSLSSMPSRGYKGMVRIWNSEDNTVLISLVPCIVRPETMFRGFWKN